ncbi:citramalate synthase, partial [Klebsiella pneumoniae]
YVECGWPGANPTDTAFFANPPKLSRARVVAFGMTKRAGRSASNDPGLAAVLDGQASVACLVGKTWDFHVEVALGTTLEENLASIRDSVAHAIE